MSTLTLDRSTRQHVHVLAPTDECDSEGVPLNPDPGIQLAVDHGDPTERELGLITHSDAAAAIAVLTPAEAIDLAYTLLRAAGHPVGVLTER